MNVHALTSNPSIPSFFPPKLAREGDYMSQVKFILTVEAENLYPTDDE